MQDPTVARRDDLVEVLHGMEVADPYRWMEDLGSAELATWVDAVADEARVALDALPDRDAWRATVTAALDVPRCGLPERHGQRWFQLRNSGLQDHDVLWVADDVTDDGTAPTSGWRVLLDPGAWDGAAALAAWVPSHDGRLLAHAVTEAGSDWQVWRVLDVATGELLDDTVRWSKFSGAAWSADDTALFTTTFPAPDAGRDHEAETRGQRVVRHRIGGATEVVHALPDDPRAGFEPRVSHDGRWLVLTVSSGTDPETRLQVASLRPDGTLGEVRWLVSEATAAWHPAAVVGGELWAITDAGAPRRRVVALDLATGAQREVLAEGADQLEVAHVAGATTPDAPGWLVTSHLRDAASVVTVHDLDGRELHTVALGGLVSAGDPTLGGGIGTSRRAAAFHVVAAAFDRPSRLVRHDPATGATTQLDPCCVPGDDATDEGLVVDRVFVTSGDVRVPVFLLHRADVTRDGTVPTVLWGYGGFGIAVTPHHRPAWRAWVDRGGLVAVACLRGGAEYGRAWADDGRLRNKQHVFDDALAVAGWLCGEGEAHDGRGAEARRLDGPAWTAPAHLGVEGRSNGGLLAAACLVQAPERFGSVVPEVGVLDLARFHRFTIGWAWTSDYGDPEDPEDLRSALAWSPLHNVEHGRAYPPTLVTTADTDDRVVPSHSFKFAAALRHAQGGTAPVLLRVDRAAGHGAGKPTSQVVEERVDVLAWHAHHLGPLPAGA